MARLEKVTTIGKRNVYVGKQGSLRITTRGMDRHPGEMAHELSKGDARKLRKALRAIGRTDLVEKSLHKPVVPYGWDFV